MNEKPQIIVFYDGVCGLCNRWITFLSTRDTVRFFHYAPLQGETAKKILTASEIDSLKTMIVWTESKTYIESDGVLFCLSQISTFWQIFALFCRWIPGFIRNAVYRYIAERRYRWFGKYDSCPLPPPGTLP